jgi:hypothetical protein
MAFALEADVVDGRVLADAGDDVLKLATAGFVEEDVVCDDDADLEPDREIAQFVEAHLVVGTTAQRQGKVCPVAKEIGDLAELDSAGVVREVGDQNREKSFSVEGDIVQGQNAVALAAARFPRVSSRVSREYAARSVG